MASMLHCAAAWQIFLVPICNTGNPLAGMLCIHEALTDFIAKAAQVPFPNWLPGRGGSNHAMKVISFLQLSRLLADSTLEAIATCSC